MLGFRVKKKGRLFIVFMWRALPKSQYLGAPARHSPCTHMPLPSFATSVVNSWLVGMDPEPDPRIRTTYFTDPDSDPAADSVKSRYTSVRLLLAPIMNFVLFCIQYV
jgi:hypothetical protein